MSRVKVVIMALSAFFAVSAMAVSSASAEWLVGGTTLVGSAALATTALVDEPTKLLVPSVQDLTIECAGEVLDGVNPRIEAPDKGFASALSFLSCTTVKPVACVLSPTPQTITTNPILALAVLGKGEEDRVTFKPETKTTFAEVAFTEPDVGCAFEGLVPIKGSVTIGAPTGQLELLSQAIVGLGSSENNSLEIGSGNKAYLVGGRALLKLVSDSKWSFM